MIMIKKTGFVIAMAAALSLTACGSQQAENAQLKQQVEQLKQQVADLQDQSQAQSTDNAAQPDESGAADSSGNASAKGAQAGDAATDQAQNTPTNDASAPNATGQNAPDQSASANYAHHEDHAHYDMGSLDASSLATLIQDLAQRVKEAVPSDSVQDQQMQFYEFKGEIDLAEKDLEILEDDLEAQYKAGTLSRADYQTRDQELDALEDQLDACEDQLEFIFHMED